VAVFGAAFFAGDAISGADFGLGEGLGEDFRFAGKASSVVFFTFFGSFDSDLGLVGGVAGGVR